MTGATTKNPPGPNAGPRRVHNFNAGPATLPLPVLEQAQAELLDYNGTGMSIMEMSHRSKEFEAILQETEASLRAVMGIPENYRVLFMQGGASLQFSMLPMNWLPGTGSADYLVTGAWGQAAVQEAQKIGVVRIAASTEDANFDRLPHVSEMKLDPNAAYLHFTSNETIHGVQWPKEPAPPDGVPLVCDMSSDILSRPVDVSKYGLVYAGAQKNAGPAGVTLVIVRQDLLERTPPNMPVMLDYRQQAAKGSMHNTPPTFAIYVVGLVLRWLQNLGGLPEIARHNEVKAQTIYAAIDRSAGFYRGHARPDCRSRMNVTFRLPTEELEASFAREATAHGMIGLKGHRSVGGLRASLYNALPLESAQNLAMFMDNFRLRHAG
jgi:phosphoserine aminotransferase